MPASAAGEAVNQAEVFAEFGRNIDRLRAFLTRVLESLPAGQEGCTCASALDGLRVPFELP